MSNPTALRIGMALGIIVLVLMPAFGMGTLELVVWLLVLVGVVWAALHLRQSRPHPPA